MFRLLTVRKNMLAATEHVADCRWTGPCRLIWRSRNWNIWTVQFL